MPTICETISLLSLICSLSVQFLCLVNCCCVCLLFTCESRNGNELKLEASKTKCGLSTGPKTWAAFFPSNQEADDSTWPKYNCQCISKLSKVLQIVCRLDDQLTGSWQQADTRKIPEKPEKYQKKDQLLRNCSCKELKFSRAFFNNKVA